MRESDHTICACASMAHVAPLSLFDLETGRSLESALALQPDYCEITSDTSAFPSSTKNQPSAANHLPTYHRSRLLFVLGARSRQRLARRADAVPVEPNVATIKVGRWMSICPAQESGSARQGRRSIAGNEEEEGGEG